MKRGFWLIIGGLALALGLVGIVLPILPTTPFIILAAFAFGKSVPRLRIWLEQNRTFGPMIASWKENGAIAPRYKAIAMVMMMAAFVASLIMGVSVLVLAIQAICILGAATFILTRPNQ